MNVKRLCIYQVKFVRPDMLIKTSRFGEIEVQEDQIITIPSGLIGFSEDRRFVIREDEAAKPFLWLQSVDNDALAFVMIEPHFSFSNFLFLKS